MCVWFVAQHSHKGDPERGGKFLISEDLFLRKMVLVLEEGGRGKDATNPTES